ncbi:MAG: thioredoxin-dependent thiol peroxidase [Cryomorphaceae bacterium]|nr:thioredoxin-dependent thiol peroxidase [Cryomorphaceae bacterium]MBT7695549.1 thioredoxin-dependent thiol peroxidase [Cryomorphaceae bacterium]
MLKIGDKIPNINVTTHKGESINLSDLKGKKIVLFFYPRANTPGCTAQSCNLNDNYSRLTSQGYEVVGVSPDTVEKQNKFADKFGFKYNLLADDSRELIDAFGVWGKKKFRGNEYEGVHRTTFIISEEGIIEKVIDKVNTKDHTDQII